MNKSTIKLKIKIWILSLFKHNLTYYRYFQKESSDQWSISYTSGKFIINIAVLEETANNVRNVNSTHHVNFFQFLCKFIDFLEKNNIYFLLWSHVCKITCLWNITLKLKSAFISRNNENQVILPSVHWQAKYGYN